MNYSHGKIKIYYTAGSFGHFLSYLFKSHFEGKLLDDPFTDIGNSHNYQTKNAFDITGDVAFSNYISNNHDHHSIFVTWPEDMFFYSLHASIARTASFYGKTVIGDGITALEKNAYFFISQNKGEQWNILKDNLKEFFNFDLTEKNCVLPYFLLCQYYFFVFCMQNKNRLKILNDQLKSNQQGTNICVNDIVQYDKLSVTLYKITGKKLDFVKVHEKFLLKNKSLIMYDNYKSVIVAVKNKQNILMPHMDYVTEAGMLYELEKYFYDIPFFNMVRCFKNTQEILDYVTYFPHFMKQPNKLFQTTLRKNFTK